MLLLGEVAAGGRGSYRSIVADRRLTMCRCGGLACRCCR